MSEKLALAPPNPSELATVPKATKAQQIEAMVAVVIEERKASNKKVVEEMEKLSMAYYERFKQKAILKTIVFLDPFKPGYRETESGVKATITVNDPKLLEMAAEYNKLSALIKNTYEHQVREDIKEALKKESANVILNNPEAKRFLVNASKVLGLV